MGSIGSKMKVSQSKGIKWIMLCKDNKCTPKWTSKLENPNQNRNTSNGHEIFYESSTCYEHTSCKKLDPGELK